METCSIHLFMSKCMKILLEKEHLYVRYCTAQTSVSHAITVQEKTALFKHELKEKLLVFSLQTA